MTYRVLTYNDRPLSTSIDPGHADRRDRVALIQGRRGWMDPPYTLTVCDGDGGFLDMAGASWGAVLARAAAWAGVGARIRIEPAGRHV